MSVSLTDHLPDVLITLGSSWHPAALDALRPGLTCDAEILTSEKANATTVPLQSVVIRPGPAAGGEASGVFVVEGDRARFQPVTTGIIGGLEIEVSGVGEGTKVVTGPYQALRDLAEGSRIRLQER